MKVGAVLLAVALLLLVAWSLLRGSAPAAPTPIEHNAPAETGREPVQRTQASAGESGVDRERMAQPAAPASPVPTTGLAPTDPSRVTHAPIAEKLNALNASAHRMNVDEYELLAAAEVDGETAMQLYYYVKSCIGRPRHPDDLDARLSYWDAELGSEESVSALEAHDEVLSVLERQFERCGGLATFDLVALAIDWLTRAAAADHLPAQIAFYNEVPALLATTRDRVFREPHYIDLHNVESERWLTRALRSGHPDAFDAMGRAVLDGVLYEPDPPLGLAYLRAGERARGSAASRVAGTVEELEATLDGASLRLADDMTDALCRRYGCGS